MLTSLEPASADAPAWQGSACAACCRAHLRAACSCSSSAGALGRKWGPWLADAAAPALSES
eukprot:614697-Pyramimonas_sp.AAC.1